MPAPDYLKKVAVSTLGGNEWPPTAQGMHAVGVATALKFSALVLSTVLLEILQRMRSAKE